MSFFELGMLICFGAAWPMNIYKSLTVKSAKGKSLMFQYVIILGYISGITHKLLYSQDIIICFYIVNLIMVSIDTALILKNRARDKEEDNKVSLQSNTP